MSNISKYEELFPSLINKICEKICLCQSDLSINCEYKCKKECIKDINLKEKAIGKVQVTYPMIPNYNTEVSLLDEWKSNLQQKRFPIMYANNDIKGEIKEKPCIIVIHRMFKNSIEVMIWDDDDCVSCYVVNECEMINFLREKCGERNEFEFEYIFW